LNGRYIDNFKNNKYEKYKKYKSKVQYKKTRVITGITVQIMTRVFLHLGRIPSRYKKCHS